MIREKPIESITTQDELLRVKCKRALTNHRRRAKVDGTSLDYGTLDLIRLAQARQTCEYCSAPLGWDSEFDHFAPISRGGPVHCLANITLCCRSCNQMKGSLNGFEFIMLLQFLKDIDPRGAADVRHRLKAGGAVHVRRKSP